MEEKKIIKLGLFQTIIIAIIVILLILFIIITSINKHSDNKKVKADLFSIKTNENQMLTENNKIEKISSKDIAIVPTLEDKITTNSAWCGTLQLVWNDMINNVVKQDVIFTPQTQTVENLNRQLFKEDQLSEKDYYKVYDLLTKDLKKKIEKSIRSKFNEKSDILDQIDWSKAPQNNSGYLDSNDKRYLFYAMLYKKFKFENKFDELKNGMFGTKYKDIKYFGIDGSSDEKLYSQVDVLYYNSEKDFAIILNTEEGEEVILTRGAIGNNFATIYNNIVNNSNNYSGKKQFTENDYLKVPNIKFNVNKTFNELCNNKFYAKNGDICNIEQAIQTIKVELDREGGKIKSEAAVVMSSGAVARTEPVVQHRYFYLNDEFTMFLKESDKDVPYFAANIEDITLFQN